VLLAVLLVAAVYDVRFRRIPNWATMTGVVLGLALNAIIGLGWPGVWFSLRGLGLGFGVYLVLYVIRAMGAGDVKLMAAVGALVGWRDWLVIFFLTAILGGVMAVIMITTRGRIGKTLANIGFILTELMRGRPAYLKREELDARSPKAVGLAHGAVIAVATVFFLALSARYSR
jgi:prepilin peptidase CpaA